MKIAIRAFLPLLFCAVVLASDTTVEITSQPSAGNPLENSGHVTYSERVEGQTLISSRKEGDWTIKNVSPKDIIGLVESMDLRYPSGQGANPSLQYDAFWETTDLKPGGSLDYPQGPAEVRTPRLIEPTGEPSAVVKTLWVQFSDSTTWGDPKYAAPLMDMRKAILDCLGNLKRVYETQGPEEFAKQLNVPITPQSADFFVSHIRDAYQKDHDVEKAYHRVTRHLAIGEQRLQAKIG